MNAVLSLLTEAGVVMRLSARFVCSPFGSLALARSTDAVAYSISCSLQRFLTLVLRDTLFVSSIALPFILFY